MLKPINILLSIFLTVCLLSTACQPTQGFANTPPANPAVVPATFADVIDSIAPSVVTVTTEAITIDSISNPHVEQDYGSGWIVNDEESEVASAWPSVSRASAPTASTHDAR